MSLLQQSQHWYPTHVKVVVIRARGLRSKGKDGTNDAYAIMQLGKEKYSSSVAEKNSEPLWREEAEFELPILQQVSAEKSTLYLIVMHRALVGLDKFLGQAAINLRELCEHKTRNKVGWHKLQSKPGKEKKERGEIEVDIRFVRNNMTASMFDLSMKDKSRSTLGKLKDKFKGKKKDGFSDSMSAVVPSISVPADSDEEAVVPEKKKKSKLKLLFPKSNLQQTSLSQSMSVIPTGPSPADVDKKTRTFGDEDFTEVQLHNSSEEESSSKTLSVPKIMSHKRASSADTKQLNLAPAVVAKKETLSLFGGLRPKSDPVSQSNLCINGNHVYAEERNPITHAKPKSDSKSNSQFYTSLEDLPSKLSPTSFETSNTLPTKSQSQTSSSDQALKPATLPASQSFGSTGDLTLAQRSDRPKDVNPPWSTGKEEVGKNVESASTLEGSTKSLNPFEDDKDEEEKNSQPTPKVDILKVEAVTKKEEPKRGGLMALFPRKTEAVKAPGTKDPLNPFDMVEAKKPPSSFVWSSRTAAIKPKLDMSPQAEIKASPLSSPLLSEPHSPSSSTLSDPFSSAPAIGLRGSNFSGLSLSCSPPVLDLSAQPRHSLNAKSDSLESSPSCVDELYPSPSLPPPAVSSSSSSRSSDTQATQLPTAELIGAKAQEVETPFSQGSKTSAQLLFQELTGRKPIASDGQQSSYDGEHDSVSVIKQHDVSQDVALETKPEGKFENTEEDEKASSEQQQPLEMFGSSASQEKGSMDPPALIDLDPVPTSEANLPMDPPKVPPRRSLPSLGAPSAQEPLFSKRQKVSPTPTPRNLTIMNKAVANETLLQSAEGQPLEDLISFNWKAEGSVEPVTESAVVRGTDATLAVGNSVHDFFTDRKGDVCSDTLVAVLKPEPATILSVSSAGITDDPITVEEADVNKESPSDLWPNGKMEGSAEDSFTTKQETGAGSQSPSLEPLTPPAATLAQEIGTQTPFDLKPAPTQIITAGSDHPGNLQLVRMETNDSKELANGSKSDDVTFAKGEGESFGQRPALTSAKISMKTNFGDPELTANVAKPNTLEVGLGTLDLSEELFTGHELQTSESSAVVSSSSTQLVGSIDFPSGQVEASPSALDSVGFLAPPLSPSALSHPACPVPDDPPLIKPPAGSSLGVEHSGQKKLIQARVLPTETQPIHSQSNATAVPSKRRPHPVKPMSTAETRFNETSSEKNLKAKIKNVNVLVTKSPVSQSFTANESQTLLKDCDPSDPAAAYAQLTHDELIQLVLKQKEMISRKDGHVRELENYIDDLLVRVMEETPNILRVAYQPNRKAERV